MDRKPATRRLLEGIGQRPDRDPRAVRERLALKPGDALRYRVTAGGVLLGDNDSGLSKPGFVPNRSGGDLTIDNV